MKKVIRILTFAAGPLLVAVAVLLAVASRQPDSFKVMRKATLAAQRADIFPYLSDLSRWNSWSPWRDLDPQQKMVYSANPVGQGAWVTWDGNSDAGKGKLTIVEIIPNEKVVEELHFIEPFEDIATVTLELKAIESSTEMTWTMEGKMNLISKAMCLFVSMDQMMGRDFERGMKNLQSLVEKRN